ncbi:MAG: deoxyribodipyrimidine photo-lyase [Candidatus Babeliales bacterium]
MKYNLSLFIFRRDLRITDNIGLQQSINRSKKIIPCFIFDPRQITNQNEYKSSNALQFMIESLQDLEKQLKKEKGKLYLFYGIAHEIVERLLKEKKIDAVFCNMDYTPFSLKRDIMIQKVCLKYNSAFHQFHDSLLTEPGEILTTQETPYQKFTPFFKKASKKNIPEPQKISAANFYIKSIEKAESITIYEKILKNKNKNILMHGGRAEGLKILKKLKNFKNYAKERNFPAIPTTHLSAHNKFGTVSIREVYHAIKKQLNSNHLLIQQLFWRDFFTHVAYYSPFVFGQAFHERYNNLKWKNNKKDFAAWKAGKTGFPIVDAGMRQLNKTGFMHNRTRMLVASFLTKDLHIDWLWGEKYFAKQLVDYDPAVNNGNWQWCASTGCDAQPYFRIFNPWTQQKKYDPDAKYIKQWIPELKNIDVKTIHQLYKKNIFVKNYPKPIVNHDEEQKLAKELYKKAK